MSFKEITIKKDEQKKFNLNRLLKGKLGDNIETHQIKDQTLTNRLFSSPPSSVDPATIDKLMVVRDKVEQYPSFQEALYCSLDFSLVLVYSLLFTQIEIIIGGSGNALLSLFIVFLVERALRATRHKLGVRNLVKKAFVDDRFLI